ncbi:Gp138 family membrane-puncturing spike protein [Paenibacillus sp. strain BS8-2]
MNRIDPAGTLARMLTGLWNKQAASLHVAFPCKVIQFDAANQRANVQPLIRSTSQEPAVLQKVPTLGQRLIINGIETVCLPSLHPGDVVLVVCADQEMKNGLAGKVASPDSGRKHSANDAVIVGVFPWSL